MTFADEAYGATRAARPQRIAHVVSLVSVDGAYGGPASVAVGQCAELARRGHQVTLLSGWDGLAAEPAGFVSRRFRARHLVPNCGFAALTSFSLLAYVARHAREWDVVHVHLCRDLLVLPAALICLWRRVPIVVQTHGMVVPDRRLRARIIDRLAVRRVLRAARAHLVLTAREREQARAVAPGRANLVLLANGIARTPLRAHARGTAVAEVLFCARLHPRKGVLTFVDMVSLLTARGVPARFVVIGPDEGDLPALRRRMGDPALGGALTYEGALAPAAVGPRLAAAQVVVLPSFDEPFPMGVLEAWSGGVPTVITESNGLAPALMAVDPGLVVSGTPESLADAVERLVADQQAWSGCADRARALAAEHFGIEEVVTVLEDVYRRSAAPRTPPSRSPSVGRRPTAPAASAGRR